MMATIMEAIKSVRNGEPCRGIKKSGKEKVVEGNYQIWNKKFKVLDTRGGGG